MTNPIECGSCRFWCRIDRSEDGECRRRPPRISDELYRCAIEPQVISDDAIAMATRAPITFMEFWCGEFEARPS